MINPIGEYCDKNLEALLYPRRLLEKSSVASKRKDVSLGRERKREREKENWWREEKFNFIETVESFAKAMCLSYGNMYGPCTKAAIVFD
ncbi:hypothetical protein PUN28_002888 [Cardiocondyla obscurior]|uniref:Uncharacterized protein n=1 Tax=Cardiocondyla obscurior TaxID=286306 RepID=A0AAW2GWG8_9HYME